MLHLVWFPDGQRRAARHCHCARVRPDRRADIWVREARPAGRVLAALVPYRHDSGPHRRQDRRQAPHLACPLQLGAGAPRCRGHHRTPLLGPERIRRVSRLCTSAKGSTADTRSTRHNPSWTNPLGFVALAFISASLGLQGIIGKVSGATRPDSKRQRLTPPPSASAPP